MVTLRQIRSVVAVAEEGSFTRAAARENATQSGISQHVAAVEEAINVSLFERASDGIRLTPAGTHYYDHCIEILRHVDEAAHSAREAESRISGSLRAGLMPAFTRGALAPALQRFLGAYPEVKTQVLEAYSGTLTEMVRAEELDFALVPSSMAGPGLTYTHLARDREMLVSGPLSGMPHEEPVRLADLGPLNVIVPTPNNVRRARLDEYFQTHGVRIDRLVEMDAMLGTLELVALSDWVTVLPGLICGADQDGIQRRVAPIIDPPLYSDFVVIEPSRRPLSPQARLFLEEIETETRRLIIA